MNKYYQDQLEELLSIVKQIIKKGTPLGSDDLEQLHCAYVGFMATPGLTRQLDFPIDNLGISAKKVRQAAAREVGMDGEMVAYTESNLGNGIVGKVYWCIIDEP